MLKFLIILLDDCSVSFCHYGNILTAPRGIAPESLETAFLFAEKEDLAVQVVYPMFPIDRKLELIIEKHDCIRIKPLIQANEQTDVVVVDDIDSIVGLRPMENAIYVLRLSKSVLFKNYRQISALFGCIFRLNIVITDINTFDEQDFVTYKSILECFSKEITSCYEDGKSVQLNLLTDRIGLVSHNSCGGGDNCVTLAPDGKFYVCPAFYQSESDSETGLGRGKSSIGSLEEGLKILNGHLYQLKYAPICRKCDAYQCKRCIWLNWKTTYQENIPSHEQCVLSHLERNASRSLLVSNKERFAGTDIKDIPEIDYLDPLIKKK